jgi:hypothetical protein
VAAELNDRPRQTSDGRHHVRHWMRRCDDPLRPRPICAGVGSMPKSAEAIQIGQSVRPRPDGATEITVLPSAGTSAVARGRYERCGECRLRRGWADSRCLSWVLECSSMSPASWPAR